MDQNSNFNTFKELIGSINKVLFSYDVDSATITFLNNAFSQVWQQTKESALSNPAVVLNSVHPEDKAYLLKEFNELLAGALKQDVEFRIIRLDKSVRYLLLNPRLIVDTNGTRHIAGLIDDITTVKENYRDLERHGAKKNSILEILSHDLAVPLANIQALADVLSESTQGYNDKEVSHIIDIIRRSSTQSVRMIREFVHQEFLESSSVELFATRENLVVKMLEVVEQYKSSEGKINKEFRFSTSSDTIHATIDSNKFMQVINNLISNAIKFTKEGGLISIDLSEQNSTVLITIKDNGIGIPKKYHDKLFDRFTPARRQGLLGEPSTGLGMSIIKTIVEWHKGRIWFESEENVGTTFYIEIPK